MKLKILAVLSVLCLMLLSGCLQGGKTAEPPATGNKENNQGLGGWSVGH